MRLDPRVRVAAPRRTACAPPASRSTSLAVDVDERVRAGRSARRRTCGGWRRRSRRACASSGSGRPRQTDVDRPRRRHGRGGGRRRSSASRATTRTPRAMLRRLSGRAHEVLTGVSLRTGGRRELGCVETTAVWFAPLGDAEIAWYVASGEGRDKAGAYAIQGLASRFIPRIEGSYSNVVGLPVAAVDELLLGAESPAEPAAVAADCIASGSRAILSVYRFPGSPYDTSIYQDWRHGRRPRRSPSRACCGRRCAKAPSTTSTSTK